MGTTLNSNILFGLSGVTSTVSGYYMFEQNPESYSILAPKQLFTILPTLEGNNIYQRALLDNDVRVMKWSQCSSGLFSTLRNYSERTVSGTIPIVYFWDGTVKEFQGAAIQVIDVYGTPIKAMDTYSVELQFKPVTQFDKEYNNNLFS